MPISNPGIQDKKINLTCALIGLRSHAPNELLGVVAEFDFSGVMLELEVVLLPVHRFLAGFSEDFLALFFADKLGTLLKSVSRMTAGLKGSFQNGG